MELRWRAFRLVPWVWSGWERFYLRLHPIQPIRDRALFAVSRKGDALELHLLSRQLNRMRGESGYSTFKALHTMREDLTFLAARLRSGDFAGVGEIRAKTLMGGGAAPLGFHTRVAPRNLANAFQQYFQVGLDAIYHPRGLRTRAQKRWPVEIWMSVAELLGRYPAKSDSSTVAR